mgnify:CR=1 FL=1
MEIKNKKENNLDNLKIVLFTNNYYFYYEKNGTPSC